MNLIRNRNWLVLLLFALGFVSTAFSAVKSEKPNPFMPVPDDGDFLPDTVNVFHIAKDVSNIFMNAIDGTVYHDINGDTAVLNAVFNADYAVDDIGQAYKDAIEQKIKAEKGDFGLNVNANFTENFTPGFSVDEDLTFKRRLYVGLEWDIIKGGLFDAGNKIHQLKMQSILKEYESLEFAEKENYRYLFNYINYIFNDKKIELLKERKGLVSKQLKFTRELYHLRYVGWEKVLKYQEKLDDIDYHIYQYEQFNKHIITNVPDTLISNKISADDLPLFDINLDSLMKIYYKHHSTDTVTQIKLAIYKDQIKWWKDISLRPFVRYNMFVDEFNAFRNYGSAGASLRVPLRFHNKGKLIRAQETIYESEQMKELESGDNELVNIYSEFGFKLKQIKDFYYKKMLNDELIRKELVKKEYHDVAFNPVYTLGLIDEKKAVEAEIIDLKKRMYINLVRLAFYLEDRTPTDFITVLQPSDFTGRYDGSIKMFVTADDIQKHSTTGIVNYLWKNEFVDVIVENEAEELSADIAEMTEKSKLANIFYSIMRRVPKNGEFPDVAYEIGQVLSWDNSRIIGLHYNLDVLSQNDTMNEVSEVDISDWVSSLGPEVTNSSIRLSIDIPSGLSINLLNRIFNKFDLVFVHDDGSPNVDRVKDVFASEMNLNHEKLVLKMQGSDFSDRIHLENYLSSLYQNTDLTNFSFSNLDGLMKIDFETFEKGSDIDLQPGDLIASVRDQIYYAEEKEATQVQSEDETETTLEEDVTSEEVDIEPEEQKTELIVVDEAEESNIDDVQVNDSISDEVETTVIEAEESNSDINTSEDVEAEGVENEDIETEDVVTTEEETTEAVNETIYRIQIAASKKKLSETKLLKFKAEDIREIKINEYFKYTIGNYISKKDANSALKEYKTNSENTSAFLVTY